MPRHDIYHCPRCHRRWRREPLTAHQLRVLRYVREYLAVNKLAPALADLQAHFGWSSGATAHEHLATLERKGYIARGEPNTERSITLILPVP